MACRYWATESNHPMQEPLRLEQKRTMPQPAVLRRRQHQQQLPLMAVQPLSLCKANLQTKQSRTIAQPLANCSVSSCIDRRIPMSRIASEEYTCRKFFPHRYLLKDNIMCVKGRCIGGSHVYARACPAEDS